MVIDTRSQTNGHSYVESLADPAVIIIIFFLGGGGHWPPLRRGKSPQIMALLKKKNIKM